MTAKELSEICKCSRAWIYFIAKQLGRLPTVEEVNAKKNMRGRPTKYKEKGEK